MRFFSFPIILGVLFALQGCVPTGMTRMPVSGGERQALSGYTKRQAGNTEGRLIFKAAYQDVATAFIKSGTGLLEPVYELKQVGKTSFTLQPDWEATRDLHKALSSVMTLLPLEDSRLYAQRQVAQIEREQAVWLANIRRVSQEAITGRAKVTGSDLKAMFSEDKKEQRRAWGGGIFGQMMEASDPIDKSPYAAPFYSKVLADFDRKGASFVISPTFDIILMHQLLNLSFGAVAETADQLGDSLKALQRYVDAGGGVNAALAAGAKVIQKGPLTMVTGPISIDARVHVVSTYRALSGAALSLHWQTMLSEQRSALAFMSMENFRSVESAGGRLNASLGGDAAQNLVAMQASMTEHGGEDLYDWKAAAQAGWVPPAYDLTHMRVAPVPRRKGNMFGSVDWTRSLDNTFSVLNRLCGTALVCLEGGGAEKNDYVQLAVVGANAGGVSRLRTAGVSDYRWKDWLACDGLSTDKPGRSADADADAFDTVRIASCQVEVALQTYLRTVPQRRQALRSLTRTAASTFADARKELKLTTGLQTRPLD